jgi:hypothetical protein
MSVEKKIDNMKKLADAVGLLGRLHPMVGIPQDKSARKDGPIGNAALLYIHTNGAPEVGIPARDAMTPGIRDAQKEIERRLRLAGEAALDGRASSVRAQMAAAGQAGASAIKARINSNIQPPLSPRTLAARRRRGVKRTNTLVDTAQMRNAVTYVVREEK